MARLTLPAPPNPRAPQYRNQAAYLDDVFAWMQQVKGLLETTVNTVASPAGQQFLATNFTTNTIVSGTMTGTDAANCIASLVQTLTQKGILSPTTSRSQGQ